MANPNVKTIGIKVAAYRIIKAVSESRKNTTKPDGICDIATEAIEKAFGGIVVGDNGYKESAEKDLTVDG